MLRINDSYGVELVRGKNHLVQNSTDSSGDDNGPRRQPIQALIINISLYMVIIYNT